MSMDEWFGAVKLLSKRPAVGMRGEQPQDKLMQAVANVVQNDNCSGCGACALLSERIQMKLAPDGFLRPVFASDAEIRADSSDRTVETFNSICPGRRVNSPRSPLASQHNASLGWYVSSWEGWATDDEIRRLGSSGGVLTAISDWLVRTGQSKSAVASADSSSRPGRTVPVRIMTRDEALAAAGSRYAPVSTISLLNGVDRDTAIVAKPCEASALRQLHEMHGIPDVQRPILLSFFCAGTPSQHATDVLCESLGVRPEDVTGLRYRGDGWPGNFAVSMVGDTRSLSYDESWGKHLGRALQRRCKICPDGVGESADIAVGDYWAVDDRGYPLFHDDDGRSAVIARTQRGHELLMTAVQENVITLREIDINSVAAVQPLQVQRRRTLAGRLTGRLLAGKRIPRYVGFGLLAAAARNRRETMSAARGTWSRSR